MYSLLYFWLRWVFVMCKRLFSSCGKWGLLSSCSAWGSHFSGFSSWGAQALGTQTQQLWHTGFSCSEACGIFSKSEIKPMFPTLVARFITVRPPGKPLQLNYFYLSNHFSPVHIIFNSFPCLLSPNTNFFRKDLRFQTYHNK